MIGRYKKRKEGKEIDKLGDDSDGYTFHENNKLEYS